VSAAAGVIAAGGVLTPYTVPGPLMDALQVTALVLVAAMAAVVVAIRTPVRQVIALSVYGLLLALLFLVFQAPDVTLSELSVGAIGLPLFLMLALVKVRRDRQERDRAEGDRQEPRE
jgi:energy-converting hydrogenase B subunit D